MRVWVVMVVLMEAELQMHGACFCARGRMVSWVIVSVVAWVTVGLVLLFVTAYVVP